MNRDESYPNPNATHFITSDTPLVAYLISEGFELTDINYDNKRALMSIKNDGKRLKECVDKYNLGIATGNIPIFFNAYKGLVRKLKNEVPT